MKVLQILPELNGGGVERGTLEVGKYLVGQGHESLVVSNGGRLVPQLEAEGSRHIGLPVHRKRVGSLRQVKVLRCLLEKERPDVLHLRSRLPAWLAWLAWRKMDPATRPRLVTTVHGFYSVNAYSRIMTRGERVICVSGSVKDHVLQNYPKVPEDKLTVIHRGVDPEEFPYGYKPTPDWAAKWLREFPQLEGKYLITLPGRITQLKGQHDFIRLFESLDPEVFHGLIVGGTHPDRKEYADSLKQQIQDRRLSRAITFTGHRSDLREIFAVSDVVLSLTTQPESFGRTTLEALALGRPVLGYQHGGVGEILDALFPEGKLAVGDTAALSRTLQTWSTDPPKPRAQNLFTLAGMCEQTLEAYRRLMPDRIIKEKD